MICTVHEYKRTVFREHKWEQMIFMVFKWKPTQLWCRHFDCFWYLNEKWPKNDWNTTKKWLKMTVHVWELIIKYHSWLILTFFFPFKKCHWMRFSKTILTILVLLPSVSFGIIHLLSNGNLTHACIFVNNVQLLYNDISLCKMNVVAMFISFTNQILSN